MVGRQRADKPRSRTLAEAVERLGGLTWPELVALEIEKRESKRGRGDSGKAKADNDQSKKGE